MGFKQVALAAIGYINEYKWPLAKALLVPFVLYMFLDAAALLEPNKPGSIFLWILAVMVQTVFAITTYRMILLGPNSIPEWGLFRWSRCETFSALHMIGLRFIALPIAAISFVPVVGWVFGRFRWQRYQCRISSFTENNMKADNRIECVPFRGLGS